MSDDKYARTTISLPPDVKAQMEVVEEPVNWSAIACRAFEDKLAEIAARKEKKDMSDIVARLRASKRQSEDAHYKEGFEIGREWAGDTAEADELERLERWYNRLGNYVDAMFDDASRPVADIILEVVWPEESHKGSRGMIWDAFWKPAIGDDISTLDDPSFVKGFVEGALALWGEVKKEL
jgi:hypothetical protein